MECDLWPRVRVVGGGEGGLGAEGILWQSGAATWEAEKGAGIARGTPEGGCLPGATGKGADQRVAEVPGTGALGVARGG